MTRVRTTPEADGQGRVADDWWRANRSAAPGLFAQELEGVLALLAVAPAIGERHRVQGIPGLRRVLMRQSRYHVYYAFDDEADLVIVVAIWSAVRGRSPWSGSP